MFPPEPDEVWRGHARSMLAHLRDQPRLVATPWVWSTVQATMYVGPGLLLAAELHEMREAGIDVDAWADEDDQSNLLHQRYHLFRWEQTNHRKVSDLHSIVEFGAGYGAMAVVCSSLGFRGDYHLVDMPEFQGVQMAHLQTRNIRCRLRWQGNLRPDLFLSTFGLSETSIEGRDAFMQFIEPEDYLMAFQGSWGEVNNRIWFAEWANAQSLRTKRLWKMEPGPIGSSHLYLTSVRP